MKRNMNRSILKGVNWILTVILSAFGFSGCEDKYMKDEYGSPYAKFSFHGTVSDKAGTPVRDIKVEVSMTEYPLHFNEQTQTDEQGKYSVQFQTVPVDKFQIIVSDVDGDLNGSYMNDTIPATIDKTDYYEVGKGWNHGSADKEINIILNDKQ
jgi:putative lipoprotein (rSAM/lipoprotein system)